MTDRPIAFSPAMMTALLREIAAPGTGKTQTRRVLKPEPYSPASTVSCSDGKWMSCEPSKATGGTRQMDPWRALPFVVGDRLYVREAWRSTTFYDDLKPRDMGGEEPIRYECDGAWETFGWKRDHNEGRYRPPMFMPRWASRITLTVTDVRVQRVQDISDEDAQAEGVDRRSRKVRQFWLFGASAEDRARMYLQACKWEFEELWDTLNEARGFGWQANPWVVAVTFTPTMGNIDQIEVQL